MVGRGRHGRVVHARQSRHWLLHWPRQRGLGLWRSWITDCAVALGLLLGAHLLFWRRAHPCLDNTPACRTPRALRRTRRGATDQERRGRRAVIIPPTHTIDGRRTGVYRSIFEVR